MSECVQYIIVRKDLNMSPGKLAAQACHSSLGVLLEKKFYKYYSCYGVQEDEYGYLVPKERQIEKVEIIDDEATKEWLKGRFTKLVCYVKSKEKLLNIAKALDEDNIRYKLIWDACYTELQPEENNGTTLTCCGIKPLIRENVPKYLKRLQLL